MKFKQYLNENDIDSIIKSMVKPDRAYDMKLVMVNTKRVDKSWSIDRDFYIGKGGSGNAIGDRYDRFKKILMLPPEERKKWLMMDSRSGNIASSEIDIGDNGSIGFINGRHRFAVLRDMGAKKIPVAMNKESIKNAKKFGYV